MNDGNKDPKNLIPLSKDEAEQLLRLLMKFEKSSDQNIKSIAKSLFSLLTRSLYSDKK